MKRITRMTIRLRAGTRALVLVSVLVPTMVATRSAQAQTFTILHTFSGGADGFDPQYGGLIADQSGNLYGTATFGGNHSGGSGSGVVFELGPAGQKVLYTFTGGSDGSQPWAGLIRDSAGNLYGTTAFGGSGSGVVFKLDPAGNETVLQTFNSSDGANPYAPLIRNPAGSLYGTTWAGGAYGNGTVFTVNTAEQEKVLLNFTGLDGANTSSGLIGDSAGNLYGTAEYGGDLNGCFCGLVFQISSKGHISVLYRFAGGTDGANPRAPVIRDATGNLYGTTWAGGATGNGTVFKVDTTGHESVLYSFTGGTDGANPWAGLVQDAAGNLYGTANHAGGACFCGTVFKLDTASNFTVLHTFDGSDGQYPEAPVLLHRGALYGITSSGGPNGGAGTVYKITLP